MNQQENSQKDVEQLVTKFSKLTTGQLLLKVKKTLGTDFESKVDSIFKPALEKRNYLIHDFFIEHRDVLTNEKRIPQAINELNEVKVVIFPSPNFATETCNTLTKLFVSGGNNAAQSFGPGGLVRAARP